MKIKILAILLFFSNSIFSQDVILKLKNNLNHAKSDSQIVSILNDLAYEYHSIEIEQTKVYTDQALKLARDLNYKEEECKSLITQAIYYGITGQQNKAFEINEESIKLATELNNNTLIAKAYNNIANSFGYLGDIESALVNYFKASEYIEKTENTKYKCFINLNIGDQYIRLNQSSKALKYYDKAEILARKIDHPKTNYVPSMLKGDLFLREGKYEAAKKSYDAALVVCRDDDSKSYILNSLAHLYTEKKEFNKAENFINDLIFILEKIGNTDRLPDACIKKAEIQIAQAKYTNALNTLDQVFSKREKHDIGLFNMKKIFELNSQIHEKRSNYKLALEQIKYSNIISDSLMNLEKIKALNDSELKATIQERETENEFLRSQQEKNEIILSQQRRNLLYAIGLLAAFAVVALLLLLGYRSNKKFSEELQLQVDEKTRELRDSNDKLKESNIELENFAYIASHDLKEPLATISSFSELLKKSSDNFSPTSNQYLNIINNSSAQMKTLIQDILTFSKIDNSDLRIEKVDSSEIVEQVIASLKAQIESKKATIEIDKSLPSINAPKSELFQIFKNLIANGIKYNENPNAQIRISCEENKDKYIFSVKDNGIGIAPEHREKIFEMFKRLHTKDKYKGTGLGLAICKKIAEKLGGKIWIEDAKPGSDFKFSIPTSS